MFDLTLEERKVVLFLVSLAFCGLILSSAVKINCRVSGVVYPQIQLAKLNLNKVNLQELARTKSVPAGLAKRIIEYRNLHREFASLEELKEIKGVGEKRFEKLKEVFFVE